MTLRLDEETLAQLGWGTSEDREDGLHVNKQSGHQPSRIAPGDVDGRSKRNWRRKAAGCQPSAKAEPRTATDTVSRYNAHRSPDDRERSL